MISTGKKLGLAICEAVGIDPSDVMELSLFCSPTGPAKLYVTHNVTLTESTSFADTLKTYRAVPDPQLRVYELEDMPDADVG